MTRAIEGQSRRGTSGRAAGKDGRRRAIAIVAVASAIVAAAAAAAMVGGWRVNLTPSEPLGLWRIAPLERPVVVGDLVFICPPAGPVSDFGLERGYFRRGLCAGGAAPLIKTVSAIAGAEISIAAGVRIGGVPLPHSRLSAVDGEGRALSPWPGGVVSPGQIFLHSPFEGSYDSRYFGPVTETGLLGLARPVLVFEP